MEVHLFEHLQELGISLLTPNSKSSLYLFIGIQSDINYCLHFFSSVLFCFLYHLFNFYCLVCKQKGKPEFYQKVKISFFSLLPSHLTFAVLTFSFSLTLSLGSYFIRLSFSSVFFLGVIPTYSSVLSSASWISSLTISQAPQTHVQNSSYSLLNDFLPHVPYYSDWNHHPAAETETWESFLTFLLPLTSNESSSPIHFIT